MVSWAVFVATRMEARAVERALGHAGRPPGNLAGAAGEMHVERFITGIGPGPARDRAHTAFERMAIGQSGLPEIALVTGLCGALSPSAHKSEILIYTHCSSTRPGDRLRVCSGELVERCTARMRTAGLECRRTAGLTTAKIVTSPADKHSLAKTGAEVVDMESYPIVEVAQNAGVQVLVLRVVWDVAEQPIPDFNSALTPGGRVRNLAATRIALRSPILTTRFLKSNHRALRRLRRALQAVFVADF